MSNVGLTTPKKSILPPDPYTEEVESRVEDLPKGYELIGGRYVEKKPIGLESSWVAGEVYDLVKSYCRRTSFGVAFVSDAGYQCFPTKPKQVRKPDGSVIRCDPTTFVLPKGWTEEVPTLVVEVISPNETVIELDEKVNDFRAAGVPLIWVVNPNSRTVHVYRTGRAVTLLEDPAELSGEDVLPGFTTPLAAFLPALRPAPIAG